MTPDQNNPGTEMSKRGYDPGLKCPGSEMARVKCTGAKMFQDGTDLGRNVSGAKCPRFPMAETSYVQMCWAEMSMGRNVPRTKFHGSVD